MTTTTLANVLGELLEWSPQQREQFAWQSAYYPITDAHGLAQLAREVSDERG